MSEMIYAPWTEEQVAALNQFQKDSQTPTFTCGARDRQTHPQEGHDFGILTATKEGWVCAHCDYIQNWAHAFMAGTD